MPLAIQPARIDVVDALRGFAILSIMLLHNLEHFDFYYFPAGLPSWLKTLDGKIWDATFFLFAGKSYAIFALLFGLTFHVQQDNRARQGADFRGRFLWRMFLLFGFGILNSLFYQGDILTTYAILGISLVPVCKWSNKAVLFTAMFLLLQPVEWIKFFYLFGNPDHVFPVDLSSRYFENAKPYLGGGSFVDLAQGNITNGKLGVLIWTVESGRLFQAPALFMLGMLMGRKGLFVSSVSNRKFWKKTLIASASLFMALFSLKAGLPAMGMPKMQAEALGAIAVSLSNFGFTLVLVATFWLLYQQNIFGRALAKLRPFGRMSLTNYIVQSMLGSFVYYGYGLGLYEHTGATISLLIGISLFSAQAYFCKLWLKNHRQGPLENLWHKGTWLWSSARPTSLRPEMR